MRHLHRTLEDLGDVDAHQRAGHEPEIAERRVAPADVRRVAEYPAEAVVLRELLQRRARIGDGGEMPSRLPILPILSIRGAAVYLFPEIGKVRERLGGLARL